MACAAWRGKRDASSMVYLARHSLEVQVLLLRRRALGSPL